MALGLSLMPRFWHSRILLPLWLVAVVGIAILMSGGVFGLSYVPSSEWGGLPLTIPAV
nr:hypothetical protein PJ912_11105 [Pectobacterium colocasium]